MSRFISLCILIAVLALGAGAPASLHAHSPGAAVPAAATASFSPAAAPGGPFALIDQHGRRMSDADFRGKFMLVVFGYTSCPDVCPTTLLDVTDAINLLGPLGERVQPVFITVDPERDSPDVLAPYLRAFDPRIVGLTGTLEEIERAARVYKVFFRKVPLEAASAGSKAAYYSVDHTAFIYLMGSDGQYVTHFAYGVAPDRMASEIRSRMGHGR